MSGRKRDRLGEFFWSRSGTLDRLRGTIVALAAARSPAANSENFRGRTLLYEHEQRDTLLMRRARGVTRTKLIRSTVRASGKSAGSTDESTTGSANSLVRRALRGASAVCSGLRRARPLRRRRRRRNAEGPEEARALGTRTSLGESASPLRERRSRGTGDLALCEPVPVRGPKVYVRPAASSTRSAFSVIISLGAPRPQSTTSTLLPLEPGLRHQ
jgi:hypothetical protein